MSEVARGISSGMIEAVELEGAGLNGAVANPRTLDRSSSIGVGGAMLI
jgi:hypothetical protein